MSVYTLFEISLSVSSIQKGKKFQEADGEEEIVLRQHRRQSSMNTTWQQEDTVYQQRRCSDLTWAADEELQTIRSSGSRRPFSWGADSTYRGSISISMRSPKSHEECMMNFLESRVIVVNIINLSSIVIFSSVCT